MDMPVRTSEDVDLDRLSTALGFLMRLAQLKIYERFFEEVGEHHLKPGEFSVLWVILHNPGIRQSVTQSRHRAIALVRALEDQGLVTRQVPDDDRRAVEITLTPAAAEKVRQASHWFFTYEDSVGANLTRDERQQLTGLLRKFVGID